MPLDPSTGHEEVRCVLTDVLNDPARLLQWHSQRVDFALRVLRRARLLGRVAAKLAGASLLEHLPVVAQDQLRSALVAADARRRAAIWELDRLGWALAELPDVPLVALKGCAYLLADTPNADGRLFADVDLLVPEVHLPAVETALRKRGWRLHELTPYDDLYYRRWTHELPPLTHVEREVEVDLHHNILMRTARARPSAQLLLADAREVSRSRFKTPSSVDLVLHATTHLFCGGEMKDALRELVDIDDLVRHFAATEPLFWERFWPRAEALGLVRPAFYGLRFAEMIFGTPVPDATLKVLHSGKPIAPVLAVMDWLVPRTLFPHHPDAESRIGKLARLALYLRSHWVKMPPFILARHLAYKSYLRFTAKRQRESAAT